MAMHNMHDMMTPMPTSGDMEGMVNHSMEMGGSDMGMGSGMGSTGGNSGMDNGMHGSHGPSSTGAAGGHAIGYFTFNLPVYMLFQPWFVNSQEHLAAACVGSFLLAALYEGLKSVRETIMRRKQIVKTARSKQVLWHILQSLLQIVQITVSMFLMLIYMTFNGWLAISVSLGSGIGYLVFGWSRSSMCGDDHCG